LERGDERSLGDNEKWKGVMRKSFSGLMGRRRGDEKVHVEKLIWLSIESIGRL
jgi:hypothetical protein